MNLTDLTAEQQAAFVTLRRLHNRDNPTNQLTVAQLVEAYAQQTWNEAIAEADNRLTSEELRRQYKAASPSVRAQVDTLLNL